MVQSNPLRSLFPFFSHSNTRDWVYLDSAATTQKPQFVIDATTDFYTWQNTNVHRSSYDLADFATTEYERVRRQVAQFIGAQYAEEIIFTQGTTDSLNLVAQCLASQLKPGDEVLISTLEHHANIVPWQLAQQRAGFTVKVIPLTEDNNVDVSAYQQLLCDKTKLVCISQMSNALGIVTPLEKMIPMAHQIGAKVVVDGAQAIAHQEVDVTGLGADFYAFSAHKMYGPTGLGVLYGKKSLLEQMPPYRGGGEMIKRVSFEGTEFNQLPFKFEAGTPNIAAVLAFAKSIEFIRQHRASITEIEKQLHQRLCRGLASIPSLKLVSNPDCAAIASFLPAQHHHDVGVLLNQQKIALRGGHHCAMPLMQSLGLVGTLRASIGCYNDIQDVDRLLSALEDIDSPAPKHKLNKINIAEDPVTQLQQLKGRDAKMRQLMQWGKQVSSPNNTIRQKDYLVQGCESDAWLKAEYDGEQVRFEFDADARIVRGLGYLLLAMIEGLTKQQVSLFDFEGKLTELQLEKLLSPSRSNGVWAIVKRLTYLCREFAD